MAHIQIIIGPMYSGKSTELIRRCNNYEAINQKVLVLNHSLDTRCEQNLVQTHSKTTKIAVKTNSLIDYFKKNKDIFESYKVVAIDEAQFFEDLYDFVLLIEKNDIVIVIAGLDGDCFRKPFGQILECIPLADEVTKLHAMCMMKKDGTRASFTKRLASVEPQSGQIDIGAQDKYLAVCRSAYL